MFVDSEWRKGMNHVNGTVVWHNTRTGVFIDDLDLVWAYNYNAFLNEMRNP